MLTAKQIANIGAQTQKELEAEIQRCLEYLPKSKTKAYWEKSMDDRLLKALDEAGGQPGDVLLNFLVVSGREVGFGMLFEDLRELGLVHLGRPGVDPPSVSDRSYWIAHRVFLKWLEEYKQESGLNITVTTKRTDSLHPLLETSVVTIKLYPI